MADMYIKVCWVDNKLDPEAFVATFNAHFKGGEAELIPLLDDAVPDHKLYHLRVPVDRKSEVTPFLDQYAEAHGAVNEEKPSSTYPFTADA